MNETVKIQCSKRHERETMKIAESPTGFEPMTSKTTGGLFIDKATKRQ